MAPDGSVWLLKNHPFEPTLIKFSTNQPKVSYLFYPDFNADPHPALCHSIQVDLSTGQVSYRDYSNSDNPFVLHRKETFVTPDYPHYAEFAELTRQQDALGLLANSRSIGTRFGWQQRLETYHVELHGPGLSPASFVRSHSTQDRSPQSCPSSHCLV